MAPSLPLPRDKAQGSDKSRGGKRPPSSLSLPQWRLAMETCTDTARSRTLPLRWGPAVSKKGGREAAALPSPCLALASPGFMPSCVSELGCPEQATRAPWRRSPDPGLSACSSRATHCPSPSPTADGSLELLPRERAGQSRPGEMVISHGAGHGGSAVPTLAEGPRESQEARSPQHQYRTLLPTWTTRVSPVCPSREGQLSTGQRSISNHCHSPST